MPPALVTFAEAAETIRVLISLAPGSNATNTRLLLRVHGEALKSITSFQSDEFGFRGLIKSIEIYTLRSAIAWVDHPNPGHHHTLDVGHNTTTTEQ